MPTPRAFDHVVHVAALVVAVDATGRRALGAMLATSRAARENRHPPPEIHRRRRSPSAGPGAGSAPAARGLAFQFQEAILSPRSDRNAAVAQW